MSDPISDFVTVIRNAYRAGKENCDTRFSKMHLRIAEILKEEGYIRSVERVENDGKPFLHINLKYVDEVPALTGIKRVSRPGRRRYARYEKIPKIRNGLGILIMTTSKGLMTDRDARAQRIGGEALCAVW